MSFKTKFATAGVAGALGFTGLLLPLGTGTAYAASAESQTESQVEQIPATDHEKTVTENGHNYTLKYSASEKLFISYIDGQEIKRIPYDELKTQLENAERAAKQERMSKCGVGTAIASVVNAALWAGAAIAAPASMGTTITVAGFLTSLIPTVGGAIAC